MNRLIRLFLPLLCLLCAGSGGAAEGLPAPRQVSPNAWAWIGPYDAPTRDNGGFRMNLGFVVGRDAVAVIDSGYSPAMAADMLRQIRKLTPLPVRHVINTNSQPHRFLGNEVFRSAGARIVAGREAAQRMARDGAMFAAGAAAVLGTPAQALPAAPDQLLAAGETTEFDLGGGVRVAVRHVGAAHTQGSLIATVTPDRTVFAGDVLYGGRLLAILADSSVKGWIAAYLQLRGMDAAAVVPGHGQPGPLADFDQPTLAYLQRLKQHMDAAVKAGDDIEKAKNGFDAAVWTSLANFKELNGRNAYQAYQESEAEGF